MTAAPLARARAAAVARASAALLVVLGSILSAAWGQTPSTQQQYRLVRAAANATAPPAAATPPSATPGTKSPVSATPLTLQVLDAPVRTPGATEVLVRMKAVSLNRRDVMIAKGAYPLGARDSVVPLSDGAGEVVAVGDRVSRFKVGDRVAATFFQKWISGRPPADVTASALGGPIDGIFSQFVTLDQQGLVKLPASLSYEEGASLPCAAVTAWNALVTRGRLQPGDYVLLQGTGGVSIFGLQIAIASGAKPVITSSSDAKLEHASALGAVGTINYRTTPEWEQRVPSVTHDHGADQILEVGGSDTLPRSLASIAPGGHIALIGGLSGFGGNIPAGVLMARSATVDGISVGSRDDFEALNRFIEQHRIKPVIDRVFEFHEAQAAYDYMDSASLFGKVVIRL
jgi:NADPH:quinone reductase-like Zn-dependent oxidoreductase